MPKLRFRLRTLLLAMLVLGCGLGWWFRPYAIEKHWPNGKLKSQLQVRRSWNGEVVTNGQQTWWWSGGQLARRGESYGRPLAPRRSGIWTELANEELFDTRGARVDRNSITFGTMWLGFHQDTSAMWELHPADQFPETPHTADASSGGSILFNLP